MLNCVWSAQNINVLIVNSSYCRACPQPGVVTDYYGQIHSNLSVIVRNRPLVSVVTLPWQAGLTERSVFVLSQVYWFFQQDVSPENINWGINRRWGNIWSAPAVHEARLRRMKRLFHLRQGYGGQGEPWSEAFSGFMFFCLGIKAKKMVGIARFELATFCPPDKRAKPGCAISRLDSNNIHHSPENASRFWKKIKIWVRSLSNSMKNNRFWMR